MIEQLNTIDDQDEEFEVNFYDSIYNYKAWTVKVHNMRNCGRLYWWRCVIVYNNDLDTIMPDYDIQVTQRFFAATYQSLKNQIINFIAMYYK